MSPPFPVISSKIQPFALFAPPPPLLLRTHNRCLPIRSLPVVTCCGSVSVAKGKATACFADYGAADQDGNTRQEEQVNVQEGCGPKANSPMESSSAPSLFPLHHCKTLHLVRHGQGIHNVEGDKNPDAYLNPQYLDAHLTQLGWQQVDNLRKHVQTCELSEKIDLVITSPLMRTLQTAVGVFGGESYSDKMDTPPLMVANAGNSSRAAISSMNCPPVIAVELCREHLGVRPCDKRSSISDYRLLFPGVDFSLVESDEDILWKADIREANEELVERGMQFLNWLWTRKEKEIAVVTHSGFLFHTLSSFGNDCHPSIKSEICKHFANCELRSMIIVDRSMLSSDPSTTNYPGKIPQGLDSSLVEKRNGSW